MIHVRLGHVEQIYVADGGGRPMRPVVAAHAVAGRGLSGDRYGEGRGSGTGWDECQLTLIAAEDLEDARMRFGVGVLAGEHRRNLVTRGLGFALLEGRRFRIGSAVLAYDRPRPPCRYIATLTVPAMTEALAGRGGICARILTGGRIAVGDPIELIE